jgi:FMN phosphatase YigB (HAD superfamily)
MIKAVVFDFGNVLCKLDRESALEGLAAHSAMEPAEIRKLVWGGEIEREAETGRIDSRVHFERVKAAIRGEPSWSYDRFLEEFGRCIVPYPEGEAAVVGASRLGLRTFILSNTNYIHSLSIFDREILATYPELYSLSYKVGFMKPDPRIWLWLLDRARLPAGDCLYVDDLPEYCAAAASLGFATLNFHWTSGNLLQGIERML